MFSVLTALWPIASAEGGSLTRFVLDDLTSPVWCRVPYMRKCDKIQQVLWNRWLRALKVEKIVGKCARFSKKFCKAKKNSSSSSTRSPTLVIYFIGPTDIAKIKVQKTQYHFFRQRFFFDFDGALPRCFIQFSEFCHFSDARNGVGNSLPDQCFTQDVKKNTTFVFRHFQHFPKNRSYFSTFF